MRHEPETTESKALHAGLDRGEIMTAEPFRTMEGR
jgi:hypothetical protein